MESKVRDEIREAMSRNLLDRGRAGSSDESGEASAGSASGTSSNDGDGQLRPSAKPSDSTVPRRLESKSGKIYGWDDLDEDDSDSESVSDGA